MKSVHLENVFRDTMMIDEKEMNDNEEEITGLMVVESVPCSQVLKQCENYVQCKDA